MDIEQKKKNNYLVIGPSGVGKSTYIRNKAVESRAKLFRWNVRVDRSLREGREILHQQVRSKEHMYVWIEGADDLTLEAQAFLRRILETSSQNVISLLEVREPWKLSPPILSRCIPIYMKSTKSLRYEKNLSLATHLHLLPILPEIDINTLQLKDIPNLRIKGYDPIEILYKIASITSWKHSELIDSFKKIGLGYSPWIVLSYYLIAVSSNIE